MKPDINQYKIWTALITPLLENHEIDFSSLSMMIKSQHQSDLGLLILGSTGEALNLSSSNKKKILQHVLGLETKVPLMVGVGGHLLDEQIEWIQYLNALPFDAYLLVTPHYAKPGDEGQYQWFKALLDASSRPCMLYNVPSRTGKDLSLKAVAKLVDHPNFWSIKEASGSVETFKKYLEVSNKLVFCGDDALIRDFILAGASGLVSVAANAFPAEAKFYIHSLELQAQKFQENLQFHQGLPENLHQAWKNACESLFVASNPIPVKYLLSFLQHIKTPKTLPPLSATDMLNKDKVTDCFYHLTNIFTKYMGEM